MANIILPKGLMLVSYIQIMFIISLQPSLNLPIQDRGANANFRFFPATRLDCGGSIDFVLSKDRHIPDQQMIDLTGFMGLELRITEQLSLEGRIKGGFWSVTKANTNEYPFRYDPKNVVYQVGIVYYFNTDVWRDK